MELERQSSSRYDLLKMIDQSKVSKLLDDHTEYHASGLFEFQRIDKKGRGLIATIEIKPGTLLMACKAFVFVSAPRPRSIDEEDPSIRLMAEKTRDKLTHCPELADDLYKLYAGPKLGWLETADRLNHIDYDRILNIVGYNAFTADNRLGTEIRDGDLEDAGLWLFPSYLNHSCVDCNCFRYTIGDFMFIRAVKTIKSGEELLMEYVDPAQPYRRRHAILNGEYGFDCQCRLCQADRKDLEIGLLDRYDKIRAIFEPINQRADNKNCNRRDVLSMEKLLSELLQCRPDKTINFLATRIQEALATAKLALNPGRSFYLLKDLFENAGDPNSALAHAKTLAILSAVLEGEKAAEEWTKEARRLAMTLYGENEHVIDIMLA